MEKTDCGTRARHKHKPGHLPPMSRRPKCEHGEPMNDRSKGIWECRYARNGRGNRRSRIFDQASPPSRTPSVAELVPPVLNADAHALAKTVRRQNDEVVMLRARQIGRMAGEAVREEVRREFDEALAADGTMIVFEVTGDDLHDRFAAALEGLRIP